MTKLMLDFDSTLYPILPAMASTPGGERCVIENCHTWDELVNLSGGAEQMQRLLGHAMNLKTMRRIGVFPGAAQATQKLKSQGVDIHLVTHRPSQFAIDTETFLREQNIVFDVFTCDQQIDKVAYCLESDVSIMIDDHPELLKRAAESGIQPFTLLWPYNQQIVDKYQIAVTRDWRELEAALFAALK